MRVLQPDFFLDFLKPSVLKRLLHPKAAVTLSIFAEFVQDLNDYQGQGNAQNDQYDEIIADCIL